MTEPVRVLLFEDSMRENESLERDLVSAGFDVVGAATTPDRMRELVSTVSFHVAVLDVMVRPRGELLGLRIGIWLRRSLPRVGVVMYTGYDSPAAAYQLLRAGPPLGVGYLVKSRIDRTDEIAAAIVSVRNGLNMFDRGIKEAMMAVRPSTLTPTEEETLRLVVDGYTNDGIADHFGVTPGAIDARCTSIFTKLGINVSDGGPARNRRVQAVVHYLTTLQQFRSVRDLPPLPWDRP